MVVNESRAFTSGDWDFLMDVCARDVPSKKPAVKRGAKLGGFKKVKKAEKFKKAKKADKADKAEGADGELTMTAKCIHSRAYSKKRRELLRQGTDGKVAKQQASIAGKLAVKLWQDKSVADAN